MLKASRSIVLIIVLLTLAIPCYSALTDPFSYFNVYSLGDIGSSNGSYGSDFNGPTGAGGDVYFSGFSLMGPGSTHEYGLHAGGNANISGSYYGNMEVGGNLNLWSVSVYGDVHAGGNIDFSSGGSIYGNAAAGGSINQTQQFSIYGQVSSQTGFTPQVSHSSLGDHFSYVSQKIGAMADTAGITNQWGNLKLTASSGLNVFSVDASELRNAWGVTINAPEDAIVLVNVSGENVQLDSTNWYYEGGFSADNILLNYPGAEQMGLSGGNNVNILAPFADTTFSSGVLTGSLVVGNLAGSGQVNEGYFSGGSAIEIYSVPEPATVLLVGLGCLLLRRQRRNQAVLG